MKKIILIGLFLLAFTSFISLNAQWARTYGGSKSERAYSIQQTSDGGYIVAGSTLSFGAGKNDIWVLKLSSTGSVEWQRTYGGNNDDYAYSIQQTSEGGYIVAGSTRSFGAGDQDLWILNLSSTGSVEWQSTYGGSKFEEARSIQQMSEGGYIVAGRIESFGAGGFDIWVLKISSTGVVEWQRVYGGSSWDIAFYIQQTSDGGFVVTGITDSFGAGVYDIYVLKLSSSGAIEWLRTYGGSKDDRAYSIQQTSDGGYIVTGFTETFGAGQDDIWVLKLSSTGVVVWQRTYGGSKDDRAYSIRQTNDGGYILAGITESFGAGQNDFWVLKLSSTGAVEWQRAYGGSNSDQAWPIQQTSDGGYIVADKTDSFGAGYSDLLILKLFSDGDIDQSCQLIGSSNATISDTAISPQDISIFSQEIYVSPQNTSAIIKDSEAVVIVLCEAPQYTLTISSSTGGTTDPASGTQNYYKGTKVSIEATPDSGYEFSGWSGDASGTDNPVTVTMDSNKSVTANFTAEEDEPSEEEGICFIATSVYGSPEHPHVRILQDFRDTYLMPSKLGRELIDFYYEYSPLVAEFIKEHKELKVAVRTILLPLVAFSYMMLHFGL